jgi:hypothetical protein
MARRSEDAALLSPRKAKNMVAVARVLGPAVIPVISPYLLRAASTARNTVDRLRARRLGIPVDDLAEFSGRGGALHARIAGAVNGLRELAGTGTEEDQAFVTRATGRLAKLAAAIRAAERMPSPRRRAAHRAVSTELDEVESDLLHRITR